MKTPYQSKIEEIKKELWKMKQKKVKSWIGKEVPRRKWKMNIKKLRVEIKNIIEKNIPILTISKGFSSEVADAILLTIIEDKEQRSGK